MTACEASRLFDLLAAAELPAAVVEALLRLAVQSHGRAVNKDMASSWFLFMTGYCSLPAAVQLPTETLVELSVQVLQSQDVNPLAVAAPIFGGLLRGRADLSLEQVRRLIAAAPCSPEETWQSFSEERGIRPVRRAVMVGLPARREQQQQLQRALG